MVDYTKMTEEQITLINEYCRDDMKKLKKICHFVWGKSGLPTCYYDDLYDDAMNVLSESVISFNEEGSTKFKTYLTNNIRKSYKDWFRDTHLRAKRNNLELDENGKIRRDENGNPIIIPNLSFDAPVDDGINLSEKIASDFNIENEMKNDFDYDDKVDFFLKSLSKMQRKVIELKMEGYLPEEIKKKLHLSNSEYNSTIRSIKTNENLSLFSKNINDCNYKEEQGMDRVMEVNEADNYRMDKYSMYSLLEAKKSGDINCKYILQRKPFQWTQEERNRFICRLLSNLPIPEIILCEQNIKGMTIAHLIDGLQRLSYAEAFKENRFKVGVNGAERHLIQYRDFMLDENGNRVLDDGIPVYEIKVCDVIGKYYKDLPDELRKRFNNFNVNVTKFFNCTDAQIADHIRDYNNHASMNNEQLGMTKISATTAKRIKDIADKNTFFKNCGKYTDKNSIKGKIDRIVAETIMLLFYRNEWKPELDKTYQYIDSNATDEEFYELNSDLNRLEIILGENNKDIMKMFTPTNTPMWLAVFHEFITYGVEDSKFIDFLRAYNNGLNEKEIDGVSMKDFKDMQTKKKTTITGKIDLLVKLMKEYLHIEEDKCITPESFIAEVVDMPLETVMEEIDCYEETLIGLENSAIRDGSKLLDINNKLSLLAMVAYSYKNYIDLDKWLTEYAANNNTYFVDQKKNFNVMLEDFKKYTRKIVAA